MADSATHTPADTAADTSAAPVPVTRILARFTLEGDNRLGESVRAQAARAFVNHVGCAVGGSTEPAARLSLRQADRFSGARAATVFGRVERLDALHAAWINGLQSAIQTFDDTHLPSVVHPTGPVASAALALIEDESARAVDGETFVVALAMGIEVACRVGGALTQGGSGLHLGVFTTGIAGAIGAAAACGRLLGLDEERQAWALGIATAQAGGLRVSHATMTGGLIPAQGARIGLGAALLARDGFDCSSAGLEGRNGLFQVFAPHARPEAVIEALGDHFEMAELAYKPYPCGIVIHPVIDGCLDIAARLTPADRIAQVRLRVHPLALQLTGLRHPRQALDTKVSLWHWTAAALLRRRADIAMGDDDAVRDPELAALRERIEADADDALGRDEAWVEVTLDDGRRFDAHVPHARGSRARPMTDGEIDAKFTTQVAPVLGAARADELREACRRLRSSDASWAAWLPRLGQPPAIHKETP